MSVEVKGRKEREMEAVENRDRKERRRIEEGLWNGSELVNYGEEVGRVVQQYMLRTIRSHTFTELGKLSGVANILRTPSLNQLTTVMLVTRMIDMCTRTAHVHKKSNNFY